MLQSTTPLPRSSCISPTLVSFPCPFLILDGSTLQLRDDFVNHVSRNIGEPEIAPTIAVRQLGMINSQQVQDRGVDIVYMHWFVDSLPAEIVSRAKRHAALDAPPASHMVNPCGL